MSGWMGLDGGVSEWMDGGWMEGRVSEWMDGDGWRGE